MKAAIICQWSGIALTAGAAAAIHAGPVWASALILAALLMYIAASVLYFKSLKSAGEIERNLRDSLNQAESLLCLERENARQEQQKAMIQFYGALSHGMRIPVSVVLGYSDLLRGGLIKDEDVRREYLHKIHDKVCYLSDFLNQLFMEARTDAKMPNLITAPTDIVQLLRQSAADMSAAAARNGVSIHVVEAEESIMINADYTHLIKIFYNILENSLKYMGREGNINITVSRSGEQVLIVFKDDGKGIGEEDLGHIFEMNYQGINKTSGYGMGLHLAKVTVEAHGGTIFAKSGPDKGMGIYINLPENPPQNEENDSLMNL